MPIDAARADNRDNWDDRVAGHLSCQRVDRYIEDPSHLSGVIMFDRDRLGDHTDIDVLQLQCHIRMAAVSDHVPLMHTLVAEKVGCRAR